MDIFFVWVADVVIVAGVDDDVERAAVRTTSNVGGRETDERSSKGEERVGSKTSLTNRGDSLVADVADRDGVRDDGTGGSGDDELGDVIGASNGRVLAVNDAERTRESLATTINGLDSELDGVDGIELKLAVEVEHEVADALFGSGNTSGTKDKAVVGSKVATREADVTDDSKTSNIDVGKATAAGSDDSELDARVDGSSSSDGVGDTDAREGADAGRAVVDGELASGPVDGE